MSAVQIQVDVSELTEGTIKEVAVVPEGAEDALGKILLVQHKGKYFATGAKCTHYGALLKTGVYSNGHLRCPWHGACFNVETGDIEDFPGVDGIHTFPVEQQDNNKVTITVEPDKLKNNKRCSVKEAPCSTSETYVIVGGGPAACVCAETLRKEGFTGKIIVFSKEGVLPYDRPKLSKAMSISADAIVLRNADYWKAVNVDFRLNTEVSSVVINNKTLKTKNGEELSYDKVFIAPGGRPRTLPIPNFDKSNVFLLRDPQDANTIDKSVEEGKTRVVVIGSSFIGMEVASCMIMKKAASVVVVGMEEEPFQLTLGKEVGTIFRKLHEEKGVKFHLQRKVQEFVADGDKVSTVVLDDGTKLECDIIIAGIGIIPNTEFLEGVNKRGNGVVEVNESCLLGKDTYAGGDIAAFPFRGGYAWVQHIGMAMYHGKIAAENMVGKSSTIQNVPYFWTQQYGKSIRYTGNGFGWDEVFLDGDTVKGKFTAFYGKQGTTIACLEWCLPPQVSAGAELIQQDKMPNIAALKEIQKKEGSINLLKLLTPGS